MLRTLQGGLYRAPDPADDIAAIANELAVYVLMKTTGINRGSQSISKTYCKITLMTLVHWLNFYVGSYYSKRIKF